MVPPRSPGSSGFGSGEVLAVLHQVVTAVADSLKGLDDWGLAGTRSGQYRSDLIADEAALAVIEQAGFGALSEESGLHSFRTTDPGGARSGGRIDQRVAGAPVVGHQRLCG